MVTHHTASPITANARGRSHARTRGSRLVVSLIAVTDHTSALAPAFRSPVCSRFHMARQRAEQNRACSRRGTNEVPHCSQFRISDRKSTRLNSSHRTISYAVFCLKKKKNKR